MSRRKHPTAQNGDSEESASPASSLTAPLDELLAPVQTNLERYRGEAIEFAKSNPEKALLSAVAVGYVLRLLPITRILGLLLTAVAVLWKPAALIFGGRKLWERIQGNAAPQKLAKSPQK